ncbi:MAG: MEMO1 family protein [Euryarchaeota archaeon]|nr:MEMO1 family protein [Euryarchaeota archaeon]
MRYPAVAGMFYPASKEELISQIEACFTHPLGPGGLPEKGDGERDVLAAVVPHAGYVYSGYEAAHVYALLAGQRKPRTVVILGFNHRRMGSFIAVSTEDWVTPLGTVEVDREVAEALWRNCDLIDHDEEAHVGEHSIEVQLPFLQYIYGDFRFVPLNISLQDLDTAREIAGCLSKLDDVLILASSDFTHYESQESAKAKDGMALERILDMDAKGFVETVYRHDLSICGFGPIATAIETAREMGATRAELLKYGTSGDVTGDLRQVVAYAGIVFRK